MCFPAILYPIDWSINKASKTEARDLLLRFIFTDLFTSNSFTLYTNYYPDCFSICCNAFCIVPF